MCAVRAALELRMVLNSQIERMSRNLHRLYQRTIRRLSGKDSAMLHINFPELVVKFITMAMSLFDQTFSIRFHHQRIRTDAARICTQTHRSAHVSQIHLLFHQGNDRMLAVRRKLG